MSRRVLAILLITSPGLVRGNSYTWAGGDGKTDFAWYGTSSDCIGTSGENGGWRFQSPTGADFSACRCHVGTQLSDGRFQAMSVCKNEDQSVKVSVHKGASCTIGTAVEGTVEAKNVPVLARGDCIAMDVPYSIWDKTIKLEKNVPMGCQCGQPLAAQVKDGTGLSKSPLFTAADGHFDLAWYSSSTACSSGQDPPTTWRYAMTAPAPADFADFDGCKCHPGRQLLDGRYRAVSVCQQADSSVKLSVFLGSTCDGSADVEGTIKAEFVGMVHRGECVVLNIPNWPDKYIKFERGIKGLKGVASNTGTYMFAVGDGRTDFAWWGSSADCAGGRAEDGGWSYASTSPADFSTCSCHVASQLSDGEFRAMSACTNGDGSVKVSIYKGLECSGSQAVEGTVNVAYVPALSRGECVSMSTGTFTSKTVRLESGVKLDCQCGAPMAAEVKDGTSRDASPIFTSGDGNFDMAVYRSKEACGLGEAEASSWRHRLVDAAASDTADFTQCQCLEGRQVSNGAYRAVSTCRQANGDAKISVFTGSDCSGAAAVEGTVKSDFVGVMARGECVPLSIPYYPDMAVRMEKGVKLGGDMPAPEASSVAYTFADGDGKTDFAWYSEASDCAAGRDEQGGWSFVSASPADFSTCTCHGAMQSDGSFQAVSACKDTDGSVQISVDRGLNCSTGGRLKGTVKAAFVAALERGECVELDAVFDKTIKMEKGVKIDCPCGKPLGSSLRDGTGRSVSPPMTAKDGNIDLAWYKSVEECGLELNVQGRWRYNMPAAKASDAADFSSCACLVGRKMSDGMYHGMTGCENEDGDLTLSIYSGMNCSGSSILRGAVSEAFVPVFERGTCVALKKLGFDGAVRIEPGASFGLTVSQNASLGSYDFKKDDGFIDLAWYSESSTCALGNQADGGWRFIKSTTAQPKFGACKCHAGSQLADGGFRSVHLCMTAGKDVKVSVYKSLDCSEGAYGNKAVQGTVAAGSVPAMLRGECVTLKVSASLTSLGFDRTLRIDPGMVIGCSCGDALDKDVVDGSGRDPSPKLTKKDGHLDLVWFSAADDCERSEDESGSIRYTLPADAKAADLSKCGAATGREVATGLYRALSVCSWTDGTVGIDVHDGLSTSGKKLASGYVAAAMVPFLDAGRCVTLNAKLGFNKFIRIDEEMKRGCKCSGASPAPVAQTSQDSASAKDEEDAGEDGQRAGDAGAIDGAAALASSCGGALLVAAAVAGRAP